ncbi:hypothetical protein QBC43DRAFT_177487, partial [Cladorrhinum sp. PSN259]
SCAMTPPMHPENSLPSLNSILINIFSTEDDSFNSYHSHNNAYSTHTSTPPPTSSVPSSATWHKPDHHPIEPLYTGPPGPQVSNFPLNKRHQSRINQPNILSIEDDSFNSYHSHNNAYSTHTSTPPPTSSVPSSTTWYKPDHHPIEPLYTGTPGPQVSNFSSDKIHQSRIKQSTLRQCEVEGCGTTVRDLWAHMRSHNEKRECEVKGCGKIVRNLTAHMKMHDEKRENPVPCPIDDCNKRFSRKRDMKRHYRTVHLKERNNRTRTRRQCEACGKSFFNLKAHMKRHDE